MPKNAPRRSNEQFGKRDVVIPGGQITIAFVVIIPFPTIRCIPLISRADPDQHHQPAPSLAPPIPRRFISAPKTTTECHQARVASPAMRVPITALSVVAGINLTRSSSGAPASADYCEQLTPLIRDIERDGCF
jgi:hypothetical protein